MLPTVRCTDVLFTDHSVVARKGRKFPELACHQFHVSKYLPLQRLSIHKAELGSQFLRPLILPSLVRQKGKRVRGDDLAFLPLLFVISVATRSLISVAPTRGGKQVRLQLNSFVFLKPQPSVLRVSFL